MCIYTCICIYTQLNHFAVHLKLTQHCKSTILQLKKNFARKPRNRVICNRSHGSASQSFLSKLLQYLLNSPSLRFPPNHPPFLYLE